MNARGADTVSLAAAEGDEAEDDGDDAVDVGDDAVVVGDDADDEGDEAVDVGDDAVAEPWLADEPVGVPPPPPPQACRSDRLAQSNATRHGKVVAGSNDAAARAVHFFGT